MKKSVLISALFLVLIIGFVNAEIKTCPGDADGNGVIDKSDLDLFSDCYGKQSDLGDCGVFDYNDDRKIGKDDFNWFSGRYGVKCPESVIAEGDEVESSGGGLFSRIGGWFVGVGRWVGGWFG